MKHTFSFFLLGIASTSLSSLVFANAQQGRWSNQFGWPIIPIHATLLPDGQVFSFGTDGNGTQGAWEYGIWNFWAGQGAHQKLGTGQGNDIFCAANELLPNGDVLIAGGDTRNPINAGIKDGLILGRDKKIYRTGYMGNARWYPTLTTLPNGETLVHGGRDGSFNPVAIPEVYNNGGWRSLWNAGNGGIINNDEGKWFYPRNFVAPNGRIFGMTGNVMYFMDWGDNGGTQMAGNLPNKTRSHTSSAVMYQPGKILQVGGSVWGDTQAEGSRQAITVDITGGWPNVQNAPDMGWRRVWPTTTVLPNGEVLVTGGSAWENKDNDTVRAAEMWNPGSRQFRTLASAQQGRLYHSIALLLPDASVLVAGGGAPGPWVQKNAEVFYPPYLFNGNDWAARPTIGDFNTAQSYNKTVGIPFGGAGGVSRVTLVRNGSVTHSFNMGQRFLELGFNVQGNTINVTMPNSPNIAPPGHYMLFVMNNAGVPSVSKIIQLNGSNAGGGGAVTPPPPGGGGSGVAPQNGGVYQLVARFSNKCVDVAASGTANGTNIQQYACNGTNAQKFRYQANANGSYRLVNIASNKCVDVSGPSAADGANIHQWDCYDGAGNQAVRLAPSTAGSYQLKFDHSAKCMDVSGPNAADGTNIHQWTCYAGAGNQEFYFKP